MTDDQFWAVIELTASDEADPDRQLQSLRGALADLPPSQIEAFEASYRKQMNRAYTWDLWGAAYVVHGGASDDGFEYFRSWMISKGRDVFEAVLAKPDNLADLLVADVEGVLEFEEFAYVPKQVWSKRSGKNESEFPLVSGAYPTSNEPQGIPFEEDAVHLAARYPKLWRRFGEHPLE